MSPDGALPPFRWGGGEKRRLLKELLPRLPDDIGKRRYVEPFLGGGALFFALAPKHAVLNDLNEDLINTYHALQEQDTAVLDVLWPMLKNHDAGLYYLVRDLYNAHAEADIESEIDEMIGPGVLLSGAETRFHWQGPLLRAAWFIYLMVTCFNGLYRVNKSGAFNTPMGDKVSFSHHNIDDAVRVLRGGMLSRKYCKIELRSVDFAAIAAEPGDFLYADPPYAQADGNFIAHTAQVFGYADQIRLRDFCMSLNSIDVKWMQTNSDVQMIRELYHYQGIRIEQISAPRTIAANGDRTDAAELIIRNY